VVVREEICSRRNFCLFVCLFVLLVVMQGDIHISGYLLSILFLFSLPLILIPLLLLNLVGSHGSTDVTGFGLVGHASNLAKAQALPLAIRIHTLPIIDHMITVDNIVPYFKLQKGFSAETSGGLLILMPADTAHRFVDAMRSHAQLIQSRVYTHLNPNPNPNPNPKVGTNEALSDYYDDALGYGSESEGFGAWIVGDVESVLSKEDAGAYIVDKPNIISV